MFALCFIFVCVCVIVIVWKEIGWSIHGVWMCLRVCIFLLQNQSVSLYLYAYAWRDYEKLRLSIAQHLI